MTQPGGDTPRGRLGRLGEDLAVRFLQRAGYRVLERNWRCARGEIDVVVRDSFTIVFVEVKTRTGIAFGHPLEALTEGKMARLRSLAVLWRQANPTQRGDMRIDAIGVLVPRNAPYSIEHIRGVFS
jgi:putative endonuclease